MILSFAPIALLIFLLFSAVQLFGADASYGPNQVALLIASGCAGLVGMYRGLTWSDIQESMVAGLWLSGGAEVASRGHVRGRIGRNTCYPPFVYYGTHLQFVNQRLPFVNTQPILQTPRHSHGLGHVTRQALRTMALTMAHALEHARKVAS